MLAIQKYLKDRNSLDNLDFGIKAQKHDSLPLVILNYDQLESPKVHPIVRECRGLVLRSDNYDLVARGFNRFFNWGEVADEMTLFNFDDFIVQSKEDGSFVLLYYFDGRWMANTRGSFARHLMDHQEFTWEEAFCKALKIRSLQDLSLDKEICYVCEFCSPYNKIVRRYSQPVMFLLTAFRANEELSCREVDGLAADMFLRPQRYDFNSIEAVQEFLQAQAAADPTYEGVVICDNGGRRWKIKSATYLGLHRLKGEGDNLFSPKHLLPFIMSGDGSELLLYFPEATEAYEKYKIQVDEAYAKLEEIFKQSQNIENQKDFALTIIGKTPFTGILFNLRKEYGFTQTLEQFKKAWKNNTDVILKVLFKK